LLFAERMWFSPEHLAALGSLVLLAPPSIALSPAVVPAACDPPALTLPASIHLDDGLENITRSMLEYSPTFRNQCRVLASTARLSATVRFSLRPPGGLNRARASFRRNASGALDASIEITSATDMTELLAHELEHVIEQLEGVDLRARAAAGEARRLENGAFETNRASAVGRRVAGEMADNAPDELRRAGATVWRVLRRTLRIR
jgi:hypothetical protein